MSNVLTYKGKKYDANTGTDNLMNAAAFIGDSLPSVSLPVDTLTAVVRDYDQEPRIVAADGLPVVAEGTPLVAKTSHIRLDIAAKYGDDVQFHHDGDLVGKFKLEDIKRIGKYAFQFNCISAIGLLLTSDHYGGLYNGETAAEVMADIVGGVISYTLSDELASVPIYGLLRKAKRRDNLRDLLFAIGGQIRKDTLGELNIIPMTSGEPYEITADEFYMGGSVTGGNPATAINVTEHSFMKLPNDEIVTLYDGETAAEKMTTPNGKTVTGVLVDFSDPMYDLTIQNAEILESGVNYAVISGSPSAVLTGKKYTHTERIITRQQNTGGTPNVLTSKDCTLINLMNSELVADRLMAYYGAAKTIEADIVVTDHKPGDAVIFDDPFGDSTTGFIADMELTVSAILKAKATLVSGFVPTASGNYYSNLATMTQSGTFTVPAECKGKIRVVLIGGGDGGECGQAGADGLVPGTDEGGTYGAGGEGGSPGVGGGPGKIYVATIPAKSGQTFSVIIGAGGSGAAFGGTPGSGGDTKFGTLSSVDGYVPDVGYAALMSGTVYAVHGENGVAGGAGGQGGDKRDVNDSWVVTDPEAGSVVCYNIPGYPGEDVVYNGVTYSGGAGGRGMSNEYGAAGGGGGGGAAVGTAGGVGGDSFGITSGGDGGAGATPVAAATGVIPGSGGQGGHGGGGGGGPSRTDEEPFVWPGEPGIGGNGGAGGDGAPGIVLIYY